MKPVMEEVHRELQSEQKEGETLFHVRIGGGGGVVIIQEKGYRARVTWKTMMDNKNSDELGVRVFFFFSREQFGWGRINLFLFLNKVGTASSHG